MAEIVQNLSFRNDLWDSFHIACERIKKGGIFCDNYIKFFNDFVSFTRDYAKKLITLTKSQQEDIGSTNLGWLGIKQEIESLANIYIRFSDDVESKVITPIDSHLKETERSKRKGKEKGRKLIELMNQNLKIVASEKNEYYKAMRMADESKTDYERSLSFPEVSNCSKLKKKLDSDVKKTESLSRKYQRSIEKARLVENKLFDTVMPEILAEFEVIERNRLYTIKSSAKDFRTSLQDTIAPLSILTDKITNTVESIFPDEDIQLFIMEKKSGKTKESQRLQFEPYNPDYKTLEENGGVMSYALFESQNSIASAKSVSANSSFSDAYIKSRPQNQGSFAQLPMPSPLASQNSQTALQSQYLPSMMPQSWNNNQQQQLQQQQQLLQQQQQLQQQPLQQPQLLQTSSSSSMLNNVPIIRSAPSPITSPPPPPAVNANNVSGSMSVQQTMEMRLSKVISKNVIGYCRALYDYSSNTPSELNFKKNDMISIYEKDVSGWWIGEVNGKMGFFPSVDWVEEVLPPPPSPLSMSSNSNPPSSSNLNNMINQSYNSSPSMFPNNNMMVSMNNLSNIGLGGSSSNLPKPTDNNNSNGSGGKKVCKALYTLNSSSRNELSFREGEILTIEGEMEGWYFGKNQSGQSGLFPSNLVSILN